MTQPNRSDSLAGKIIHVTSAVVMVWLTTKLIAGGPSRSEYDYQRGYLAALVDIAKAAR